MNILLGTQYHYPSSTGGTELYVHELANNLIDLGHKVAIVKIGNEETYHYSNYKVYVLPRADFSGKLTQHEYYILNQFEKIIIEFGAEIFHLNTIHEQLNAFFIERAKKLGLKCVFTSHLASNACARGNLRLMGKTQCDGLVLTERCLACTLQANRKKYFWLGPVLAKIDKHIGFVKKYASSLKSILSIKKQLEILKINIDLIFVQSYWQKKIYELNGFNSEKIIVIRLGLPTSFFCNTIPIKKNDSALGFIARFSEDKGLGILLNALKLLKHRLQIHLCIQVNENNVEQLKKDCGELYNLHDIKLYINAPKTKVIEVLDKISVLIIPSTVIETGPYVLLEALSRKTPVIGSNIGGIAELIIPNKNGYLFEVGNHVMLAFYLNKFFSLSNVDKFDDIKYFEVKSSKKYAEEMQYAYKKILNNAKN